MVEEIGCRELDLYVLVLTDFHRPGRGKIVAEIHRATEVRHAARTIASQRRQHARVRPARNKLRRRGKCEAARVDELSALETLAGIAGQRRKQGIVWGAKV